MQCINPNNIVIYPALKITNEFNDIIFGIKPSKKSLSIASIPNFFVFKILENTYETITFQNLNPRPKKLTLSVLKNAANVKEETALSIKFVVFVMDLPHLFKRP